MAAVDYFSNDAIASGLGQKTVRGGAWTAVAQAACVVVSLASAPILARLLDPVDFGLVAMVAVFTNFGVLFIGSGMAVATVQQPTITPGQVSNLFWIGSVASVCISLVFFALAPLLALLYREPLLVGVTQALTMVYLFSGLKVQHQALLERNMRFGVLSIIKVTATVLGQLAGVAWAWAYYQQPGDYWALVWIPVTTTAAMLVGTWLACRWRPGPPRRGQGTRPLFAFGANFTGFTFVNYFSRNADNLLIGWWSGAGPLGLYERAYRLVLFPIYSTSAPLHSVMTPALSRVAHDKPLLTTTYLRVLRLVLLFIVAGIVSLIGTANWWVLFILGPKYAEAGPIFAWLALAGSVQPISASASWLFTSQGRADALLKLSLWLTPATLLAFAIGLAWGPVGVAACYAVVMLVFRFPMQLWQLRREGLIDSARLHGELLAAAPLVVLVGLGNYALNWLPWDPSPAAGAGASVLVTSSILVVWLLATPHGQKAAADLRWVAGSLLRRSATAVTTG